MTDDKESVPQDPNTPKLFGSKVTSMIFWISSLLFCKVKGFAPVEINEDHTSKTKQAIYSQLAIVKDQPLSPAFGRDLRAAGRKKTLKLEEKEGIRPVPVGSCWHGKAGDRSFWSRTCYVTGLGNVFGFLWLVLNWKWGQKIGELAVIDQVWLF